MTEIKNRFPIARLIRSSSILHWLFLIISSCIFTLPACAQTVNTAKLQNLADVYLEAHHDDEHISAVALSLAQLKNITTFSVYAGTTAYDNQEQVTRKNIFPIGSITKSYIAAILVQLESDPAMHFNIDDKIDKYFPEYANWHDITVRQLLNMTSGIYDYGMDYDFIVTLLSNPYQEFKPADLLAFSYKHALQFTPGEKWDYCNANYVLLGILIERLTGHTLTDEVYARIIAPLRLAHTYYIAHLPADNVKPYMVRGYIYMKSLGDMIPLGTDASDYTSSIYGAAGAVYSNTIDIVKWVRALLTPGILLTTDEINKLTSKVSVITGQPIDDVSEEDPDGYGLGIYQIYMPGIEGPIYSYEGSTLTGRALYVYVPKRDMMATATVNSSVDREDDHLMDLVMDGYQLAVGYHTLITRKPAGTRLFLHKYGLPS